MSLGLADTEEPNRRLMERWTETRRRIVQASWQGGRSCSETAQPW